MALKSLLAWWLSLLLGIIDRSAKERKGKGKERHWVIFLISIFCIYFFLRKSWGAKGGQQTAEGSISCFLAGVAMKCANSQREGIQKGSQLCALLCFVFLN